MSTRTPAGPWGMEDGIGLFDATTHTNAEALYEYICTVDDWQESALSVEGPCMYHEVGDDELGRIEPCECADEHPGQHEVWKVVEQAQEPTARMRERNRIVRWLRDGADGKRGARVPDWHFLANRIEAGEHRA